MTLFARQWLPVWLAGMLALSAPVLRGQTPDTATLRGKVTDATHAVLAGAKITATNTVTGFTRAAETNSAGMYSLAGVPAAGAYRVTAKKEGFAEAMLSNVALTGGVAAQINFELSVASGVTHVVVTGASGSIRADQPQLGVRLGAEQINQTPLLNRRITYLPLLDAANRPAINQGDAFMNEDLFTSNGAGRRQTWFEVDGVNAVDAWGRQTIFTDIPAGAVEEMTVLPNSFSALYGYAAGSVVNIVTQSGGDAFHGDIEGLWRPSATEARLSGFTAATATSGNDLTNDTLTQPSLSLGGPLGQSHRTQFAADAEYSWEDRASPVTSPVAPGNFIGEYRGWLAFLRLDHEINRRNNLFLRSDVDSFYDTNPSGTVGGNTLPSQDRIFRRRTYSVELGETDAIGPSWLNDARAQFQLASPITEFDPVIYGTEFSVPISAGGAFNSGTSQSALLMNRQYEFSDTASAVRSRHTVTFGGDLIWARNGGDSKEFGGPIYLGEFSYNPCTLALSVCESPAYLDNLANVKSYTQSYGNARYSVSDALWSLFAQDDFRVRPDLTLNLGLRYERQTFTDSTLDFAPRVGFAYDFGGNGKTALRGGFGIYDSQIPDNSAANYALGGPTGVFNYTAAPGQIGFPASIAAAPLPAFPAGAIAPVRSLYIRPGENAMLSAYFPLSVLIGYPSQLLNPYTEQWSFGFERELKPGWVLSMDYVGSHTLKVNRPLDVDPPSPFIRSAPGEVRTAQAANCTRPLWIWWYSEHGLACNPASPATPQPPFALIQSNVNDGFGRYNALDVNLSRRFSHGVSMLASYTWSHAIDNVDPDVPGQNPNDPNFTGSGETGNAIFDQRHRFVLSGEYAGPWKVSVGGVATLGSGLPYNIVTGAANSGDIGGTTDRPVIDGAVVGRNTGRGGPIYDFSPFVQRSFILRDDNVKLILRAAAFNVFNHPNFVGYSGVWGNGAAPGPGFGQPLPGVANQLPAREIQFSAKLTF